MVLVAVQPLRQRQAVRDAGYERELHHVPPSRCCCPWVWQTRCRLKPLDLPSDQYQVFCLYQTLLSSVHSTKSDLLGCSPLAAPG